MTREEIAAAIYWDDPHWDLDPDRVSFALGAADRILARLRPAWDEMKMLKEVAECNEGLTRAEEEQATMEANALRKELHARRRELAESRKERDADAAEVVHWRQRALEQDLAIVALQADLRACAEALILIRSIAKGDRADDFPNDEAAADGIIEAVAPADLARPGVQAERK